MNTVNHVLLQTIVKRWLNFAGFLLRNQCERSSSENVTVRNEWQQNTGNRLREGDNNRNEVDKFPWHQKLFFYCRSIVSLRPHNATNIDRSFEFLNRISRRAIFPIKRVVFFLLNPFYSHLSAVLWRSCQIPPVVKGLIWSSSAHDQKGSE